MNQVVAPKQEEESSANATETLALFGVAIGCMVVMSLLMVR
jgi:hypothetical protein